MKYYKWFWSVGLGGKFDEWGTSTYFLEIGVNAYTNRQIEVYENGNVLFYDRSHTWDEYGRLNDKPNYENLDEFEITQDEFEKVWHTMVPINLQSTI
jgi:hypothetical protein